MRSIFVAVALIMVLHNGGWNGGMKQVSASVVEDCGSPLLNAKVNPEAAPTGSDKLAQPTTHSCTLLPFPSHKRSPLGLQEAAEQESLLLQGLYGQDRHQVRGDQGEV